MAEGKRRGGLHGRKDDNCGAAVVGRVVSSPIFKIDDVAVRATKMRTGRTYIIVLRVEWSIFAHMLIVES